MTEKNEYAKQKDSRTIKILAITYFSAQQSPGNPEGLALIRKTAYREEEVSLEDLKHQDKLGIGERNGWFYTDAELAGKQAAPAAVEPGEGPNTDEWGVHELVDKIRSENLNVTDTVALAQGSAEAAQRVLEAEKLASDNDPRKGVVDGLEVVIKAGNSG